MPSPLNTLYPWRCRHYTSHEHATCDAGVRYEDVKAGALPCFRDGSGTCGRREFPDAVEVERHLTRQERRRLAGRL